MKKNQLILFSILFVTLTTFGQTAIEIAKTGIKSTVSIVALDNVAQPLGYGSGFIIDDELIATNVHVIEGSNSAYVLLNGQEKKYTVSGYVSIDKANDLVILKVSGLYGSKLSLASEATPEIGEKIFAVGNPKGLDGTFSEGIVSGIRTLQLNQVLQITAPISPGSSGGPVINSSGQVVGVAFASFTSGQNLNFAIPVKYLLKLKTTIGAITPLATVKKQVKSATTSQDVKDGVIVRNLVACTNCGIICCSIKNNLPYTISDIKILFLVYDGTGTISDSYEATYFNFKKDRECIKPFLAKSNGSSDCDNGNCTGITFKNGYKIKARVLDFKIIEE